MYFGCNSVYKWDVGLNCLLSCFEKNTQVPEILKIIDDLLFLFEIFCEFLELWCNDPVRFSLLWGPFIHVEGFLYFLLDVVCFCQVFGERFPDKMAVGFIRVFVDGPFLLLEEAFLSVIQEFKTEIADCEILGDKT